MDRLYARQLQQAVDNEMKSLTFLERVELTPGGDPEELVQVDIPPGDI